MNAQKPSQQALLPRAQWIEEGIIDAGGTHEPYTFIVRRGGQRHDAYERSQRLQSEETLRRLRDQGVEVFHTHLYKGGGMAHERPEMEETKKVAAMAHRLGLKVDTYIQWNTLMYETFFAEEPRAQNWIQRDAQGRPILLTYGYQQSFRYRPCFANQEYLDYLKEIVRYAITEVKTDFIHFDNFDLNPEPDSCHCPCCVSGFRAFLRAKYSPQQRRERFGFQNVDYVNPPLWNRWNPPERMEVIYDPVIQEWIDYRCQVMADALHQMASFAKSLNPEVVIEINPHGITGANRPWVNGIDHARLLPLTQVFWTEEGNLPAYLPDGRLVHKIRSYKLARAYRNILFTYLPNPLAMAEGLAFNQTIGYAGTDPLSPDMLRHIAFYRQHRALFAHTKDVATVAVLRSYASLTYHHARAQLAAILAEQALIQAHIPFHLIFDADLADLSDYRVVILPDSACLSDAQLERIRAFVEAGGGLVATGHAGLYDEWRRLRVKPGLPGLADVMGHDARAYEERVETTPGTIQPPVWREVGKGRVAYLPHLVFDGTPPPNRSYFTIGNEFWKRPANWQDFVESVRWAAGEPMPVEVEAPEYVVVNPVIQTAQRRMMIHLVNYGSNRYPKVENIRVTGIMPEAPGAQVTLLSPEWEGPVVLEAQVSGKSTTFVVPTLGTYTFAVVQW